MTELLEPLELVERRSQTQPTVSDRERDRGRRRLGVTLGARFAGVCTLALALGGCGVDELGEVGADSGGGGGEVPEQVARAFEDSCAVPGCHQGSAPAGGLNLEPSAIDGILSADSAQTNLPLVRIGDVGGSFIAVKVLDDETLALYGAERVGRRMPIGNINDRVRQDIAIIIAWIAGADIPPPVDGSPMGTDGGAFDDEAWADEAWTDDEPWAP